MGKRRIKESEVAAIEDLKRKLRNAESRGDHKDIPGFHNLLGNQHRLLGNYEDAIHHHKEEARLNSIHNRSDKMGLGIAFRNLGEVYTEMKEEKRAFGYIKKYLKIAEEVGNVVEEQRAYITLGRTYVSFADRDDNLENDDASSTEKLNTAVALKKAEDQFRKAYELLDEGPLKLQLQDEKEFNLMKCNNCHNLGWVLELEGKHSAAFEWLTKAIEIGKRFNFVENLAPCYSMLCGIHIKSRKFREAVMEARNAAKAAKALGNLALEVESILSEIKALFLSNEVDPGKKLLKKLRKKVKSKTSLSEYLDEIDPLLVAAVRISRTQDRLFSTSKEDKNELAKLHEVLGDNYTSLSNFDEAITQYKLACKYAESAGIKGKKLSRLYFSIAESYRDLEKYDYAYDYYKKEMAINRGNLIEEFKTQTNITLVLEKMINSAMTEEVISAHEEAIKIATMLSSFSKEITARKNFALYLNTIGENEKSEYQNRLVKAIKEENDVCETDDDPESQDLLGEDDDIDLDNLSDEDDSDEGAEDKKSTRRRQHTKVNEAGETQLHLAAKKGDLKGVIRLIRQGVPVKATDNAGWTPLHEACNFGFAQVAEELLKNGAIVSAPGGKTGDGKLPEKVTPLHDAAGNGHFDVIKILLKYKANVLARDIEGRYPIDILIDWREYGEGVDCSEEDLVTYREVIELIKDLMEKAGKPYHRKEGQKGRRRMNRNETPTMSLLVRKAHDYECPIPVKIATDDFDPDQEGDGRKLYQSAMKQIGRKNSEGKSVSKRRQRAMSPGPRGALIPAELDVHEDWLLPDGAIAETKASSKPKRKRDPMDDIVYNEQKSGGNKQRRKSRVSICETEENSEPMDIDLENVLDTHYTPTSSSNKSTPSENAVTDVDDSIILETDENFMELLDDYPLDSKRYSDEDFLPSQNPSSVVEFGKTVDIQSKYRDSSSESDDIESVSSHSSLFRNGNKRFSKRSPSKSAKNRNNVVSTDDDDDTDFKETNKNRMKASKLASALKYASEHQSGGSRNVGKSMVQTRLPIKVVQNSKSRSSRLSDEVVEGNGCPEIEVISGRPRAAASVTINESRFKKLEVWRLKVWINGKSLLVPVEENHWTENIDWLAGECARRYFDTHGLKPILTLQTKDGAILTGSDRIDLVLDNNDKELEGVVTSFDLPPLPDRYCSACDAKKIEPDADVKSNLSICQSSNVLNLTDVNLRTISETLMSALKRQNSLNTLILSGCSMFDKGLMELSGVLPTLSGLTYLDLSTNGITKFGFNKFAEVFAENNAQLESMNDAKVPLGISTLIFSHNPLGNYIGSSLSGLLNRLTGLKRLEIADCDFTEKLFTWSRSDLTKAFSNSRLEELDISYNDLKELGIEKCLQSLPARRIRALNCSSCNTGSVHANNSSKDAMARAVCSFLSKNEDCCNLTTLKLNDCGLNDKSMEEILDTFDRLVRLETLELSLNDDLTATSFTKILERSVDRQVPLRKLDLGGIPRLWNSSFPSQDMILNSIDMKMSSSSKLCYLKLPSEQTNLTLENSQEPGVSKLESRIIALMEDYAGSANFNYKQFGTCITYCLDD